MVTVPISLVASLVSGFSESLLPTVLASGLATLVAGIITLPFSAAVTGLREVPGYGTEAQAEGRTIRLGRAAWVGAEARVQPAARGGR